MKKLYFIITLLLSANSLFAQSKVTSYESSYFKKTFDISASQEKNDTSKFTYYVDCESLDKLHKQVDFFFTSDKYADFITYLNSVKQTYSKWAETAKANNVTELSKDIDVKAFKCSAAFGYGSSWQFDFHATLSPRVKIVDGKMLLILSTGELQSSSNQFMKHDGLAVVFTKPSEIDDFIAQMDMNKFRAFFGKRNNVDALFKN